MNGGHAENSHIPRPTLFHDGDVFISLAAGTNHSAAVSGDGEVFTWERRPRDSWVSLKRCWRTCATGVLAVCVQHGCHVAMEQYTPYFPTPIPRTQRGGGAGGDGAPPTSSRSLPRAAMGHEFVKKSLVPVPNPALKGRKSIAVVAAGYAHTLVLMSRGDVYSFGYGGAGALGMATRRTGR
eukprot:jgi/Mesvir1/26003/Mv07768-RA.1